MKTMKEVLAFIEENKQEFAKLPLFEYMQDTSIHPRQRLSFAPCLIPLAMDFGHVCKYVWREEPTNNQLQALINQHTYEEHFHWQWLLEDIEKMGINDHWKSTKTISFIWGEEARKAREVCRLIERYTFKANPIQRLIAIEVSEVTANVFFSIARQVALELQSITKQEYKWFGMSHSNQEDSHNLNTSEVIQILEDIKLTEQCLQSAFELTEKVFMAYSEAMNECLEYAKKQEKMELVAAA